MSHARCSNCKAVDGFVSHYAVFPPSLPDWCIRASTSDKGCCAQCGAQQVPVVEHSYKKNRPSAGNDQRSQNIDTLSEARGHGGWQGNNLLLESRVLSYRASCACGAAAVASTVLDPFMGTGSTLLAADRLGRSGIGCELSPSYVALARKRLESDAPIFAQEVRP